MKFKFILVILLLSASLSVSQDITDMVEQIQQSVVMIKVYDVTGSFIGQGSGVFIDKYGFILTNEHVIKGAFSAEVLTVDSVYENVIVYLENTESDLALIHIFSDSLKTKPISISEDLLIKPGQHVIAIGNPLGLENTVSDGIISSIRRENNGVEYIQTTVPISPGSSGGVLVNESGQLLGITTFTFEEGQNINFAISIKTILNVIKTSPDNPFDIKILKPARKKVWYRVILKFAGNILVYLIAAFISGTIFWFIIPLFILYYMGKYIIIGIKWIVLLPVRYLNKKNRVKEGHVANIDNIQVNSKEVHDAVLLSIGKEFINNKTNIERNSKEGENLIFHQGDIVVLKEDIKPPYKMFLVVKDIYNNDEPKFTAVSDGRYTCDYNNNIGIHYCNEFRVLSDDDIITLLRDYSNAIKNYCELKSDSVEYENMGFQKEINDIGRGALIIYYKKEYFYNKRLKFRVSLAFGTLYYNQGELIDYDQLKFLGVRIFVISKLQEVVNRILNSFRKLKKDGMILSIKLPIYSIKQLKELDEILLKKD